MALPPWLRKRLSPSVELDKMESLFEGLGLHTVCQSAHCPNLGECFKRGTATFLILGGVCTRNCRFCAVPKGKPDSLDPEEPEKVAQAARKLSLRHVVVTSVTRDDLPDGGAYHFKRTIQAIREVLPFSRVEVLTPDFKGERESIRVVAEEKPEVFNHNLETVPRLYPEVRPGATYSTSLQLLEWVKADFPQVITKSGLMVGLGETKEEVIRVLQDLRGVGCDMVTIGQYLRPSGHHLPVSEYLPPPVFAEYREIGLTLGFKEVASGPFVRSSYLADRSAEKVFSD